MKCPACQSQRLIRNGGGSAGQRMQCKDCGHSPMLSSVPPSHRRHFIIPDRQIKPGVPMDHNEWIGRAIAEYKPDSVIDLGDNADFPSMSTHSAVGSRDKEGQRLLADINAANEGERLLMQGKGDFEPDERVRLRGNHEHRLTRFIDANPVLEGIIGLHLLDDDGWDIVPYADGQPGIRHIDGVAYAHYFANPNTGKPIAGTIDNRLSKIGSSFVQGHAQGLKRGNMQYATGVTRYGVVAGSAYMHDEPYKGASNSHWRGVLVLNEVRDGEFCEMPLTLDYLCRKYEKMSVGQFLRKKYKNAEQRFTLARLP